MGLEGYLLGGARFVLHQQHLEVPPGKAVALLSYLCLCGPTSRSKLADLLWSDFDEDSARTYLRQLLYKLKPLDLLQAGPHEIGLKHRVSTDAHRFEFLLKQGQVPEAVRLYRGELLGDMAFAGASVFEQWLEQERERLGIAYRQAQEAWQADLERLERWQEALDIALQLLQQNPLHERYYQGVMRLYGQLGQRDKAIEYFDRCREVLFRELGLTPLPETLDLAQNLRQSNQPNPSLLPSNIPHVPTPPLVGRQEAWVWLEQQPGKLALLLGQAGVGKSRLAHEFLASQGGYILLTGQEVLQSTPLFPIAQTLRQAHQQGRLEALSEPWRSEVARLLPELANPSSPPPPPSPDGRARFMAGLVHGLQMALGRGGLLLEDLHCFDGASLEVVAAWLPQIGGYAIATARPDVLGSSSAATLLQSLERGQRLAKWTLNPLTEAEVLTLVQRLSGQAATLFSRRLFQATGGNPFFLLETLRALFASGHLLIEPGVGWATPFDDETTDYRELPLAATVREAVLYRVDGLGGQVRRLLEAASLSGDWFEPELLWSSTALWDWEGLEALERASQAGLIQPQDHGYRFAHDLVRRTLSEALSPERKRIVHRKLASSLEAASSPPERIAWHLEQAGQSPKAVPFRIKAAEAATQLYSYEQALEHYQHALQNPLAPQEAYAIHRAKSLLWGRLNHRKAQGQELQAMSSLAAQSQDVALQADAANRWASYYNVAAQHQQALSEALGGLALQTANSVLTARLHFEAGTALRALGQIPSAEKHLRQALPLADLNTLGAVQAALGHCAHVRADYVSADQHHTAARQAFNQAQQPRGLSSALSDSALALMALGQYPQAERLLQQSLGLIQEMGITRQERYVRACLAELYLDLGQVGAAQTQVLQALELSQSSPHSYRDAYVLLAAAKLYRHVGHLAQAQNALEQAIQAFDASDDWSMQVLARCQLAELWRFAGHPVGEEYVQQAQERFAGTQSSNLWVAHSLNLERCWWNLPQDPQAVATQIAQLDPGSLSLGQKWQRLLLLGQLGLTLGDPEQTLSTLPPPTPQWPTFWAAAWRLRLMANPALVLPQQPLAIPAPELALLRLTVAKQQSPTSQQVALQHLQALQSQLQATP